MEERMDTPNKTAGQDTEIGLLVSASSVLDG